MDIRSRGNMGYRKGNAVQQLQNEIPHRSPIRLFSITGCCYTVIIFALAFGMGWFTYLLTEDFPYPPCKAFEQEYVRSYLQARR